MIVQNVAILKGVNLYFLDSDWVLMKVYSYVHHEIVILWLDLCVFGVLFPAHVSPPILYSVALINFADFSIFAAS